jgi:hypothetical protein
VFIPLQYLIVTEAMYLTDLSTHKGK